MRFRATIDLAGKTATGFKVPEEVIAALGGGKRPAVRVTINGFTYRSTVAPRGDRYLVGVNADNREGTGVAAGDEVDIDIEFDTQPRDVTVPPDFAAALDPHPDARRFFDGLSYSQRSWFVAGIEGAKKPETRQRRVEQAVARLRDGRGQR
jgi:hypothetical protein